MDGPFQIETEASDAEAEFIDDQLGSHNKLASGQPSGEALRLAIRSSESAIVAGLLGWIGWDWLHVRVLWVHEDRRGLGMGRALLTCAEAEAARRGLVGSSLTSFSFQAPGFYERLGYREIGRIDDYPRGGALHLFEKRFET